MSDQNETRDRQPEGRRPAWQSGTPRGQERVVSYESDERYWTDYLRVALPVVGLLLMLGLLFWWANSIIGEDQGTPPTSTVASETNVALAPSSTPVNTVEAGITPTVIDTASTPDENGGGNGTEEPDDQATEEPDDCDGEFAIGDPVQIASEDGANFRDEPNLADGDFPILPLGTELEISSECFVVAEDDEDTRFWEVTVMTDGEGYAEGDSGFVAEQLLEPVEE